MTPKEQALIRAIALREGTTRELAKRFAMNIEDLRVFAHAHQDDLARYRANPPQEDYGTVAPQELSELWIGNKTQRLTRLQTVADIAYDALTTSDAEQAPLSPAELATLTREFRSYLMLAANELGQLLNRGAGESGEGTYLSVEMNGVNMDDLK